MLPTENEARYVLKKLNGSEIVDITVNETPFKPKEYFEKPIEGIKRLFGPRTISGEIKDKISFGKLVEMTQKLND